MRFVFKSTFTKNSANVDIVKSLNSDPSGKIRWATTIIEFLWWIAGWCSTAFFLPEASFDPRKIVFDLNCYFVDNIVPLTMLLHLNILSMRWAILSSSLIGLKHVKPIHTNDSIPSWNHVMCMSQCHFILATCSDPSFLSLKRYTWKNGAILMFLTSQISFQLRKKLFEFVHSEFFSCEPRWGNG